MRRNHQGHQDTKDTKVLKGVCRQACEAPSEVSLASANPVDRVAPGGLPVPSNLLGVLGVLVVSSFPGIGCVGRERNRQLVRSNDAEEVERLSRQAFGEAPDPRKPVSVLSALAGVGPATASAVMAAYAPQVYPFFDELVAAQIPGLGPVAFTAAYYAAYGEKLRERAAGLTELCGQEWTAQD